jgi:hypothetical protein
MAAESTSENESVLSVFVREVLLKKDLISPVEIPLMFEISIKKLLYVCISRLFAYL